ncbi:MAG TPA: dihydrofolate reductase family protein [Rhodothermales bacterium]
MGRLIMWNLITLDGCFEGPEKWSLDFHDTAWGDELQDYSMEQLESASMIVFGRVTYEGMANYWPTAKGRIAEFMNSIPKVVFSNTVHRADWNNTRIIGGNATDEVPRLKSEASKDLLLFGSAALAADLMRAGQIDEYRLCLAPIVLGNGRPLFKPSSDSTRMRLLEALPLQTGGIILRYEPAG